MGITRAAITAITAVIHITERIITAAGLYYSGHRYHKHHKRYYYRYKRELG